ncbi:DUF2510 domain-containing protein [Schumannella soli]|uniref:DUF2510 domain-containing protein n=1 Tax=Schumannella soli TaxID=2590779 RepID=A0A506Y7G9_9MICO|nr:DUF2510 domain-containing protein [Schumannella soli]TPW77177.1 DUF2510 domain-containing protein [Schumannella soli]
MPSIVLVVGIAIALAGFVSLPFDLGLPLFVVANAALGLGLGLAMVGYTVGPTLLVSKREQGGLAGLTASTTALTFVITPTLGTALYGVWGPLPIVVGIAVLVLVLVFLLVHPAFAPRRAPSGRRRRSGDTTTPARVPRDRGLAGIPALSYIRRMTISNPYAPLPSAPGWYPDGQGGQRHWDGAQWTAHSPAAPQPQYATPQPQYATPQPQYGTPHYAAQPGYGAQPMVIQRHGMATAALVLGICGFVLMGIPFFIGIFLGGPLDIVAVILGIVALTRLNQKQGVGKVPAIFGIVLGGVSLLSVFVGAGWIW